MGRGLISGALVLLVGVLMCALAPAAIAAGPAEAGADAAAAPAAAGTVDSADCERACGVPYCYYPRVNARPGYEFRVSVQCLDVIGATVLRQPAGGTVDDITWSYRGIEFDIDLEEDAPRNDSVVLTLTGPEGSQDQTIPIEAIPVDQNRPPVCEGDEVIQRSDGSGPVDLFFHPYCWDPENDPFTIRGGPPGTHSESPMKVAAGDNNSNWYYRTATFSGVEEAPVWGTDILGARGENGILKATVGPLVNRAPECRSNAGGYSVGQKVFHVYSRPGVPRRFPMICIDEDGDDMTVDLTTPPKLGLLSMDVKPASKSWWGNETWIDATYAPLLQLLTPDRFGLTARTSLGDSPEGQIEMTPRLPPANSGGGCGWSSGGMYSGVPGTFRLECDDEDGDPLFVVMEKPPLHGTASPAIVTPSRYGSYDIQIPYLSDPGYLGYDCMVVTITDGIGEGMKLTLEMDVREPLPEPVPFPEITLPPPISIPPVGIDRKSEMRAAQKALGTTAVDKVRTRGGASVWARDELSRDDLMHYGRAPAMVVICRRKCQVRSGSVLGRKGSAPGRLRYAKSARYGNARDLQLVSLAIGREQRSDLRRSGALEGKFRLSIRPDGERSTRVERAIPVGP